MVFGLNKLFFYFHVNLIRIARGMYGRGPSGVKWLPEPIDANAATRFETNIRSQCQSYVCITAVPPFKTDTAYFLGKNRRRCLYARTDHYPQRLRKFIYFFGFHFVTLCCFFRKCSRICVCSVFIDKNGSAFCILTLAQLHHWIRENRFTYQTYIR